MLGAFFDDSGTHAGSPVVAIGGVLGTEEQWDQFALAWQDRLDRPLPWKAGLRSFHLGPCRNARGEFEFYNLAERDHVTYLFRQIILELGMVTIASTVNNQAWNELVTGEFALSLGKPLEFCFVRCVDLMLDTIRARKPWEKVHLFFDQGTKLQLDEWSRFYKMQKDKYPEIEGIGFAPVPKVIALQSADMIAYESYQYAIECLKYGAGATPNPHFQEFMYRDLSAGMIMDREHIAEMIERFKKGPPPRWQL